MSDNTANAGKTSASASRTRDQIQQDLQLQRFTEISGAKFNEIKGRLRLWRFTSGTENHNGVQYRTGLNIDPVEFNPSNTCSKGGMYFCDETQMETMLTDRKSVV